MKWIGKGITEKQRKYFDKTFENSFKTIMYHMIISGRQTFCNQKGGENQIKSIWYRVALCQISCSSSCNTPPKFLILFCLLKFHIKQNASTIHSMPMNRFPMPIGMLSFNPFHYAALSCSDSFSTLIRF